jgi:hypothetical protein
MEPTEVSVYASVEKFARRRQGGLTDQFGLSNRKCEDESNDDETPENARVINCHPLGFFHDAAWPALHEPARPDSRNQTEDRK